MPIYRVEVTTARGTAIHYDNAETKECAEQKFRILFEDAKVEVFELKKPED